MARADQDRLRFELLRVRASIERTELRAAVLEFKTSTQPLRRLFGIVTGVASAGEGRREGPASLVSTILTLLRERPWLFSAIATIAARRGARRWLLLGAVAAMVAWLVRGAVTPKTPREDPH